MEELSNWIWDDNFWLPVGYTWADLQPTPGINKPKFSDLYYVPVFATILLLIRYLFETFVATPFCYWLGIPATSKIIIEENTICEHVYTKDTKHPKNSQVAGLAKQLGWDENRVQYWFRRRRKSDEISLIRKSTESCWRALFYFVLFTFGSYTILPTDWFYDTDAWMRGYIHKHDFNVYIKSYYLLELSFYTSLLFSQFIDAKRKDFYQMFLHHIVTIMLIWTSFAINHHRIGVVIMWLHDASDFWLEGAKVFNYAKKQKLCDALFVGFAVMFFLTRWIYYPFWVLHAFLYKAPAIIGPGNGAHTFQSIKLVTLQLLHLYWGGLIAHMVYKLTVYGKVDRDTRSENECSDGEADNCPDTVSDTVHVNGFVNKKKK